MVQAREELGVVLSLKDRFTSNMSKSVDQLKSMGKAFGTLSKHVKLAGAAIAGSLALMSRNILKTSADLVQLNQATGFSIERLQKLGLAAEFSNSSLSAVKVGVRTLAKAASEAADGIATYKDEFDKLGVSVVDNSGNLKNIEVVFDEVVGALGKTTDKTQQLAAAQILLGRAGTELLPLIEGGADGLERVGKIAEDMGIVIKGETVEALEVFGNQMNVLKQSGKALVAEGLLAIAESLPAIVGGFFKFVEGVNLAANELQAFGRDAVATGQFLGDLFNTLTTGVNDLKDESKEIKSFAQAWDEFSERVKESDKTLSKANREVVKDLEMIKDRVQKALAAVGGDGQGGKSLDNLNQKIQKTSSLSEELSETWGKLDAEARKINLSAQLTGDELSRLAGIVDITKKAIDEKIASAIKDGEVTLQELQVIRELQSQLDHATSSLNNYSEAAEKAKKRQEDINTAFNALAEGTAANGFRLSNEELEKLATLSVEAGIGVSDLVNQMIMTRDANPFEAFGAAMEELRTQMIPNFRTAFVDLGRTMQRSITDAFDRVIFEGQSWKDSMEDLFKDVLRSFTKMALDMATKQIFAALLGGGGGGGGGFNVASMASGVGGLAAQTGSAPAAQSASGFGGVNFAGVAAGAAGAAGAGGGFLGTGISGTSVALLGAGIGAGVTQQQIAEGDVTGSTLGGAATGAMAGAIFGPIGMAAGALIGGAAGFFGGRSEKKKLEKQKKAQRAALAAQQEELRKRREEAAKTIKETLTSQFGGGLATKSAAGEIGELFTGDVTVDDVMALEEQARRQAAAQQAQQLVENTVSVGSPQVTVTVGSIGGSYDAQNLGRDIGIGLGQGIHDAAASV